MAITGDMVNWAPFWIMTGGLAVVFAFGAATVWAVRGGWKLSRR